MYEQTKATNDLLSYVLRVHNNDINEKSIVGWGWWSTIVSGEDKAVGDDRQ